MSSSSIVLGSLVVLLGVQLLRAADAPVYDIPRVDNVKLDGTGEAWSAGAFRVDGLCNSAINLWPRKEFAAQVRLAWNQQGLIALVRVTHRGDDESKVLETLWQRDCVEFFVVTKAGEPDLWQLLVGPGVSEQFPALRKYLADNRKAAELKNVPLDAEVQRVKTPDGYVIEALLPWKNLGIQPALGREIGFQIYVDHMEGGRQFHAMWHPKLGPNRDSGLVERLRLADHAAPTPAAIWGDFVKFHNTQLNVIAPAELAGKDIDVREEGGAAALASGRLAADGDRSTATLVFAMPPKGKAYGPLRVAIAGRGEQFVDLGDPEPGRLPALLQRQIVFSPAVFSTDQFPACDFDDPTYARDLVGPYTLSATFYDGQLNKVDSAAKPGRYGAIIEVATAEGKHFRRFTTLYRTTKPIDLATLGQRGASALVDAGIDPAICDQRKDSIETMLRGGNGEMRLRASLPILLAGLSELDPKAKEPFTMAWGPSTMDRDYWYRLQKKTSTFIPYNYLVYLPDGYDADHSKRWPMLIMLHGSGAQGDDLQILKREGAVPENLGDNAKNRPFIVIIPQARLGEGWNVSGVEDLLDDVSAKYRVDSDRIYLTGGSMGGFGAWAVAMTVPDRFAALAVLCGGADPADAPRLQTLPVWIFHGDHDPTVNFSWSTRMFQALSANKAPTRFTVYAGAGHDIGNPTYQPYLYQWFLEQSRGHPAQAPTTQPTVVPYTSPAN